MRLQSQILRYLSSRGAVAFKIVVNNKIGCPDILCCYRGRFIGIEVKSAGDRLTGMQKYWLARLRKAEGYAFEARCLTDVKAALAEIDEDIDDELRGMD